VPNYSDCFLAILPTGKNFQTTFDVMDRLDFVSFSNFVSMKTISQKEFCAVKLYSPNTSMASILTVETPLRQNGTQYIVFNNLYINIRSIDFWYRPKGFRVFLRKSYRIFSI